MRFSAIAVDVPWPYDDPGRRGGTRRHYETPMSVEEIVALGPLVAALAEEHAHLYLWTPSAFLIDGTAPGVARAWGWRPLQIGTWVKDRMGTGTYLRNTTEHYLFCPRVGSRPSDHRLARNIRTHHYWPRGAHSEKPPEFYRQVVERMSRGPRLELFARYLRPGWTCAGREVDGLDVREALRRLAAA